MKLPPVLRLLAAAALVCVLTASPADARAKKSGDELEDPTMLSAIDTASAEPSASLSASMLAIGLDRAKKSGDPQTNSTTPTPTTDFGVTLPVLDVIELDNEELERAKKSGAIDLTTLTPTPDALIATPQLTPPRSGIHLVADRDELERAKKSSVDAPANATAVPTPTATSTASLGDSPAVLVLEPDVNIIDRAKKSDLPIVVVVGPTPTLAVPAPTPATSSLSPTPAPTTVTPKRTIGTAMRFS